MQKPASKASAALFLFAVAAGLSGCLKARETDRVLYQPQRDEFRLVMVLEHIDGGVSDLDYLDALRQNKDHLIAPCMPGSALGYAPWFLRLSDHQAAQVHFVEPKPGDLQPIDVQASLGAIAIQPGAFFVQDNSLCYYHALVLPGTAIDALIEQTRKDQLEPLQKAVQAELDRRKNKGRIYTWAELTQQEVHALQNGSTDHPLKPFMVIEAASLDKLVHMTADLKHGVARQGKDFTITLPLTPQDRDGLCALWTTWVQTADATATRKPDNPMLTMQRLPAQSVTMTPTDEGVVMTVDSVKFYNAFAEASAAFYDAQHPFQTPAQPSFEVRYARNHNWPIEDKLTAVQILQDFTAATLKSYPSAAPVPPGTALKPQPPK